MEIKEFTDPHFHYWDLTNNSKSGHTTKNLGPFIGERFPLYLTEHYLSHMKNTGMKLRKAVFVEAISDDPLAEATFACGLTKQAEAQGVPQVVVAYAPLQDKNVEKLLREYAKFPAIKGIRQIINHHPTNPKLTWPKVDQNFLENPSWKQGYALLSKYNLSFDLQLNPHQLESAAKLISENPKIPVILNHFGCLFLGNPPEEKTRDISTWRSGMKALSKLPNVVIKISMLGFTLPGWETDPEKKKFLKNLVHEMISLFGTKRCMFASNFPVDGLSTSPEVLYGCFREMVSDLSVEQQNDLFFGTAERVYRLGTNAKI